MLTRNIGCCALLMIVISGGIWGAGGVSGAEIKAGDLIITVTKASPEVGVQVQSQEKAKTGAADLPRELAMRPLAAYRIQPPDIIQIEIISAKDGKGDESKPATKTDESKSESGKGDGTDGTDRTDKGLAAGGAGAVSGGDSLTKGGTGTATFVTTDTVTFTDTDDKNAEGSQGNMTWSMASGKVNNYGSTTKSPGLVVRQSNSGSVNDYSGGTTVIYSGESNMNKADSHSAILDLSGNDTVNIGKESDTVKGGTSIQGGTLTVTGTISGGGTVSGGDANPTGTLYLAKNNNLVIKGGPGFGYLSFNPAKLANMPKARKTAGKASAANMVAGQYLVESDGTINLRQFGTVQIMGMTIAEANEALEKHLSEYFDSVEVSVNVLGRNHQVFYIITDGAGSGDNVRRIPITGNETVLDAIASVGGLSQFSSKKIWISRPSETNPEKGTILPVDYDGIVKRGATATNYQVMPGDRIFIEGDKAIALNTSLGKKTAPVERVLGLIGLGTSVIRGIENILPKDSEDLKFDLGE